MLSGHSCRLLGLVWSRKQKEWKTSADMLEEHSAVLFFFLLSNSSKQLLHSHSAAWLFLSECWEAMISYPNPMLAPTGALCAPIPDAVRRDTLNRCSCACLYVRCKPIVDDDGCDAFCFVVRNAVCVTDTIVVWGTVALHALLCWHSSGCVLMHLFYGPQYSHRGAFVFVALRCARTPHAWQHSHKSIVRARESNTFFVCLC